MFIRTGHFEPHEYSRTLNLHFLSLHILVHIIFPVISTTLMWLHPPAICQYILFELFVSTMLVTHKSRPLMNHFPLS